MAANFLHYIEQMLDRHHGLRDEKTQQKYRNQLEKRAADAAERGRNFLPS